ncbi:hypothetical protein FGG08_001512 [Glutinoglossum americanum]|uniref:UspA domain-containing protein n=1 Tax=Glutinoglossum americanum TaxID=1670608 RepID=A0A9P8IDG2_9PEZI|nr:hypothetical protein FGG08_001512 [Glutinoglossum americanum]
MSLESSLEEERQEVLKLLESPKSKHHHSHRSNSSSRPVTSQDFRGRAGSPAGAGSPVRSMLDIDEEAPSRHAAIAADGSLSTRLSYGRNTSPALLTPTSAPMHRSRSDAAAYPPSIGPRHLRDLDKPPMNQARFTPNSDYQFEMLPTIQAHSAPKRVTQGGRLSSSFVPNSMASVMRGADIPQLPARGRDSGRGPVGGPGISPHGHSRSPVPRSGRSQSPNSRLLNTNSVNFMPTPGKSVLDSGEVVDLNNAYSRLSDAALAKSGGSLSHLPARAPGHHIRADSGEMISPSGVIRLAKDSDEEVVLGSSEEETDSGEGSSGGEAWASEERRGRNRDLNKIGRGTSDADWEDSDDGSGPRKGEAGVGGGGATNPSRKPLSLLAAAEEERKQVSSRYKVKSLLGPSVTVTPPGERLTSKRPGVHPSTSFDHAGAGASTPLTSDTEADLTDIKRAQRMNVAISPITSTPESHRVIRTIIRGEFANMEQEAKEGHRRQRTYLVATDLSDEAAHALEWTIGTVLRDGDTLLAVYAVDEDTGTGRGGDSERSGGVAIGEGASAVKDQAEVAGSFTAKSCSTDTAIIHSPLASGPAAGLAPSTSSTRTSPEGRTRSKAEQERFHAAEDITQRCVKLLRKTRLQVRVIIEVIHCKSPKHLITEVIDFIGPTLVILGSRGRSALKGVLLGSFSNYLVTKSSVPVMVARRKLRKHSKYRTNIRLSNNLNLHGKTLAAAKID